MTVDEGYFAFLVSKVKESNIALAKMLYETEFIFPVEIVSDANRASDGIEMRYEYTIYAGEGINNAASDERLGELIEKKPCSVLEMLVALAIRIDRDITGSPGTDNAYFWFRCMLNNPGIYNAPIGLARKRLAHVLKREYDYSGVGGFFPLQHPYRDQRSIGIWEQMSDYLNEMTQNGGF